MANLKSSEKLKLEKKYSRSKATRLRAFWDEESKYLAAKLLGELIKYLKVQKTNSLQGYNVFNPTLYEECEKIVARLQNEGPVEDIDALTPNSSDKDFGLLTQSIRESIEKNQPE